jgi:hypothetical protein
MNVLYLIIGKHNIDIWDEGIPSFGENSGFGDSDYVKRIEFTDEQSRQTTIDILEQFALEDYIILDEDEYNFLIN